MDNVCIAFTYSSGSLNQKGNPSVLGVFPPPKRVNYFSSHSSKCEFRCKVTDLYWFNQTFHQLSAPKHDFYSCDIAPKHDFLWWQLHPNTILPTSFNNKRFLVFVGLPASEDIVNLSLQCCHFFKGLLSYLRHFFKRLLCRKDKNNCRKIKIFTRIIIDIYQ